MKTLLKALKVLLLIPLLTACRWQETEVPVQAVEPIPLFRASSGPVAYENENFGWVNTRGGSIQLRQVCVCCQVSTDECLTAVCSDIGSFCIGGGVWLENCQVHAPSTTGGKGWIEGSAICAGLQVCGSLEARQSAFYDTVTVQGNVRAQDTHFEGTLQAAACIIQLDHACTHDIIVCPAGNEYDPQVICIKNHSIVYGDIYFPSARGKIVLDHTSHIYGQIYGGNIIDPCN